MITSGILGRVDYGALENLLRYKDTLAPIYDLDRVTCSIVLVASVGDILAPLQDMVILKQKLHDVLDIISVEDPEFGHRDFLTSVESKTLVYDKLVKIMHKEWPGGDKLQANVQLEKKKTYVSHVIKGIPLDAPLEIKEDPDDDYILDLKPPPVQEEGRNTCPPGVNCRDFNDYDSETSDSELVQGTTDDDTSYINEANYKDDYIDDMAANDDFSYALSSTTQKKHLTLENNSSITDAISHSNYTLSVFNNTLTTFGKTGTDLNINSTITSKPTNSTIIPSTNTSPPSKVTSTTSSVTGMSTNTTVTQTNTHSTQGDTTRNTMNVTDTISNTTEINNISTYSSDSTTMSPNNISADPLHASSGYAVSSKILSVIIVAFVIQVVY